MMAFVGSTPCGLVARGMIATKKLPCLSHLTRLEFETKYVDKGCTLTWVTIQQWKEEVLFFEMGLKCFQHNIKYSIRIQVETTYSRECLTAQKQ